MKQKILEELKNRRVLITIVPQLNEIQNLKLNKFCKDINNVNGTYSIVNNVSKIIIKYSNKKSIFIRFYLFFKILFNVNLIKWYSRVKIWLKTKNNVILIKHIIKQLKFAILIKESKSYDVVFIWNPFCSAFGILGECLDVLNVKTFTIEHGPLKNSLLLDKGLVYNSQLLKSFTNQLNGNFEFGNKIYEELKEINSLLHNQNKVNIPSKFLNNNKIKIVVFGLSEVDANVYPYWAKERKQGFPFFKNGLSKSIYIAKLSNRFQVIFKPHPSHNFEKGNRQVLENLWIINGDPIEIIKWSDLVIANGTKLEIDSIVNQKPVININTGLLWFTNATYKVHKKNEILETINQAYNNGITISQINSFKLFLAYIYDEIYY